MSLKGEVWTELFPICHGLTEYIQLTELHYALRTIGSSGTVIHASLLLATGLLELRNLFGTNTAKLFPDDKNYEVYADTGK